MGNSVVFSKSDNADFRRVVYVPKYDAEVEYLQSSGTQWIDSGVTVLNTTGIEIVAQKIVANNADSFACGIRKGSRYFNVDVNHYNNNTNGILYVGFGNSQYNQVFRIHLSQFKVAVNVNNSRKVVFNDTTASWNLPNDISVDGNIYVFASNGSSDRWRGRIYYLKIYDNTTLVRDFIPVRVGSVGYMYDKVSGQLFGNSGTGNFVLGQDVAKPIVKRYVMPSGLEEGVDYQRYDWLKGDGTAYMTDTTENSFSSDLYNLDFGDIKIFDSTQTVGLFYNWVASGSKYAYLKYINSSMRFAWHITNQGYNIGVTLENGNLLIKPNIINDSRVNGICINNNKSYKIGNTRFFSIGTVGSGAQISAPAGIGITQFVQSYVSDGTIRRELKPCKLLRSIHASFDANRITRQAGECGMIDLISGKFFGNVAASGSFTVSND